MSAETANLLRMELETSDRLRGYWQDTQKKLNAAIRERDEAIKERADAVRLLRIYKGAITPLEGEGDVEDQLANCRVQLDEAQAELARVRADCLRRHNDAVDSYEEVLALRAAIEAHNKKCRYYQHPDMLIPLPPAAAAPEAGPKPEFVAPPTCPVCFGGGYYMQETWGSNGYYRKDRLRCECARLQQSPAQPEEGK